MKFEKPLYRPMAFRGKGQPLLVWVIVALLGAVLLGVIAIPGIPKLGAGAVTGAAGVVGSQGLLGPQAPAGACPDTSTGTDDLQVAVKNTLASALEYNANTCSFESSGAANIVSGTCTGGATLTYLTLTASCGKVGDVYALGSTTENSAKLAGVSAYGVRKQVNIDAEDASTVTFQWRSSAFANASSDAANMTGASSSAQSMTTGDTITVYLDVSANGTNGAYGDRDDGVLIATDLTTSIMSSSAIAIGSPDAAHPVTKIACPVNAAGLASAKGPCFKTTQIKTSDGLLRFPVTIKADLGNPGTTDDVRFQLLDGCYFRDTDGVVKGGYANSAAGDVCQTVVATAIIQTT